MTFWAKLLTIVVFVLSIAFASMSAVIFAKREDYRLKLNKMTALKEQIEADAKDAKDKADRALRSANDKSAEMKANLDALQLRFDTLGHELERVNGELTTSQSNYNSEKDNTLRLTQLTGKMGDQIKDMNAANDKLKNERDDYMAKMSSERNRANQLEKDKTDLTTKLDTTLASLKDAQDTIKLNEDTFSELSRHNIEAQQIIVGLIKEKEINGKVALVDPASNSVVLNVGRKDGVKKNFEFTIYRDSKFIAKVNVYNTEEDFSAAQITTTSGLPIQRGDLAATRLVGQ